MAGTWTTKTIIDGTGSSVSMRLWDESGVGTGPYSFGHVLSDGTAGGKLGTLVSTPTPTTIVSGQIKIAATGTAVQLPSNALVNGIVIKARSLNAASGFVGGSSVTRTDDGTGNGFALLPSEAMSYATSNSNAVWINGTIGDIFYYGGN